MNIRCLVFALLGCVLAGHASSAAPSYAPLPVWSPAPAPTGAPIVRESDPVLVTHRISSKGVTIGFSDKGGGYLNSCDRGDGINIVSLFYGRGWQHSFRDSLHSGRYNPTQAGLRSSSSREAR